jgi:hypothetical protein
MPLHGFTSLVANKYFPEKEILLVKPIASMQQIISKQLSRGDGYIGDQKIEGIVDIVDFKSKTNVTCEHANYIKLSALIKIFARFVEINDSVKKMELRQLQSKKDSRGIIMLSVTFIFLCCVGASSAPRYC